MEVSRQELMEEIREVIAEVGEIDEMDSIQPEVHFINDLGLDSMMLLEVLSTLERRYKISIPEEEFPNMVTLNSCVDTVEKFVQ
ncbi:MAG TPA: acyl carrier protein [Myxococcales bacterium]|nr:acyl carrier protein [Deltaproteobacteria bacterium]MBU48193.1 acyl carrier protein [Deltaproteobacteria bacterium]HAA54539.1 acyl carrier protein [Myxococcales bacterium]|tara:strand:+ start:10330 stop:10581 length:252 start_codon:yes stop_codon:yes gene_type:complete